jgi:ribose 5-phosphate isomerase A
LDDPEKLKREAARRALELVEPGMKLGLGTGTTARHFVDLLGERVRAGLSVVAVATSKATSAQARSLGVPLATLDECLELDLTVDGADEIDGALRLIKGGGGALLGEKIVAAASRRMVVIADGSKYVERLGAFPLPVEVAPFGLAATRRHIERAAAALGCRGPLDLRRSRDSGAIFVTDAGHYILDCAFGAIPQPEALARALNAIPGIVEHGLFLGLAGAAILADPAGLRILGDLG